MSAKIPSPSNEAVRVEPRVIKILEDFLDEARRGETVAGAIVLVRPNATICSVISAPHGGRHHLVAACEYLKQDIIAETDK
jgi:undecaprenyl pyrophosphate synthase